MDLVTVGDVMFDVHVESPALAQGGDVHGRVEIQPGGTSANAAVWAAWAGASARVHAAVGDDPAGELLAEQIRLAGVEPSLVVIPGVATGTMLVVHEAGDRSMVADRGANAMLEADALPEEIVAGALLVSGYLLLQEPTTKTAFAAIERARAPLVAVDLASWPLIEEFGTERLGRELGPHIAVLANEREAMALTGKEPLQAARDLGDRHRIVALKQGAQGAMLVIEGVPLEARAEAIVELDPTGAGDAFDGVLLACLARGTNPEEALRQACHAGALVASSRRTWPAAAT